MKILLINPPFQRFKGIKNTYFPLGLGYIAARVANEGFEVGVYNAELPRDRESLKAQANVPLLQGHQNFIQSLSDKRHPIWMEVASVLDSYKPDIVGISVMTPVYASAGKVACICKAYDSRCVVIWGGPHPTVQPKEVLQNEENVDFVVRGEGELTFEELARSLEAGKDDFHQIDGISYRSIGEIKHNRRRDLIPNLDDLPFPARNLLINEVSDNDVFRDIMASRGCPYNCAYCSSREMWTSRVRFRSVQNVIREIEHLRDNFSLGEISFWDDNFTLNRKWVFELCKEIIAKRLNISWWCNTRADLIDEEILKTIKKTGCETIHIGVETGSEKTLSYLNRRLSFESIYRATELLRKNGLHWAAYFMVGFPHETLEDLRQTRELIQRLSPPLVELSTFTPYPGTELFKICRNLNLLPENPNWSSFSHQSPENYFVKNINIKDFNKAVNEIAQEVDKLNNSFISRVKRTMTKRHSYYRNSSRFLGKVFNFLKAKIDLG